MLLAGIPARTGPEPHRLGEGARTMVRNRRVHIGTFLLCTLSAGTLSAAAAPHADGAAAAEWDAIQKYCTECHNVTDWAGSVAFDTMSPDQVPADAKVWEDAIQKLRG